MPTQNERQRHISMMRAALPYVSSESRHAMEIMLQADSLITLASNRQTSDLGACNIDENEDSDNFQPSTPDPEAMLMNIREYCTPKESNTIQLILNFIHADKLFRNYRDFAHSHPDILEAAEVAPSAESPMNILFQLINGLGSISGNFANQDKSDSPNNNIMIEFLKSQLSSEQKATFEQFQNILHN